MKKITYLILVLYICSCTKNIDFSEKVSTPIFINGILEIGKSPAIFTGYTLKTNDSINFKFSCEPNINMRVNDENLKLQSKSLKNNGCYYSSDSIIKSIKRISIEVSYPQGKKLSSSLTTPDIIPADFNLLNITKTKEKSYEDKTLVFYSAKISINISPNYYPKIKWIGFTVLKDTSFLKDTSGFWKFQKLERGEIVSQESVNTMSASHRINSILLNKYVNKDIIVNFGFIVEKGSKQSDFILSLFNIEDNYYQYMRKLIKQKQSILDPFAIPISSYSNIENGIGIFGAFAEYTENIRLELPQ